MMMHKHQTTKIFQIPISIKFVESVQWQINVTFSRRTASPSPRCSQDKYIPGIKLTQRTLRSKGEKYQGFRYKIETEAIPVGKVRQLDEFGRNRRCILPERISMIQKTFKFHQTLKHSWLSVSVYLVKIHNFFPAEIKFSAMIFLTEISVQNDLMNFSLLMIALMMVNYRYTDENEKKHSRIITRAI